MGIEWTKEQKQIFDSQGKNILVSASAGSGKTTVMIQKIINLVLKENDRTPISNFLVVTFTKASASDMKAKLVEAFMEHQDDEFCLEQIDNIDTSDISNLHSFCSRLISTYFFEIGVDPAFQVLDGSVAGFLQDKAIDKLFEKKEKQGDVNYLKLFDIFQKKRNNKSLRKIIKRFNNFLNSSLNSEKWLKDTLESAYNLDLSKNSCAKIINSYVPKKIKELCVIIEKFAELCQRKKLEDFYIYFNNVSSMLRSVNISNSYEVNAKNIASIKIPTSPRLASTHELKADVDEIKDLIKTSLLNFQNNYICDDVDYLKEGLEKTKDVILSLYSLVVEFNEIYDDMKREINGLDFNDLERKTLTLLKNPEILQALKNRYRYIFVDEYQDINSVQEEIISLISGKNNRFMVGDIKQSIYRFRLCDPDIFLAKYEQYSVGGEDDELIKLNCNFRSDKKILKFVDMVFSGVMTEDFGGIDYQKDSQFKPGEGNYDEPDSVNLMFIDTTKEKQKPEKLKGVYSVKNHEQVELDEEERGVMEARIVANKIFEIIKQLPDKENCYKKFAVLVGSRNTMVEKFIETLRSFGIKVSSDEKYDLIEKVYIQEILNFVKLLCNKNDDYLLFKVLKSRLFNFSDDELVKIILLEPQKRFFECVQCYEKCTGELQKKLENFNNKIELFSEFAKVLSVKKLCKKIVEDFSLYQINDASLEFEKANNNIDLMIDALPETDAIDFVLNYSNFSLEVENECGGNTVSVMTIHKSKGIEFEYVFLVNTTNEFNFESTYESVIFNKNLGVGVDFYDISKRTQMPTIASSGIKLLEKRKLVEEQQRVLYVALTRAKRKLFVLCSKDKDKITQKNKEHKRCFADWFERFIYNELYGNHNEIINFELYNLEDLAEKNKIESKTLHFIKKEAEEPKWFEYKYSDAKNYSLKTSISKIIKSNTLEDVFVGTGSSAERGTDYHAFLQKINFKEGNIEAQIDRIAGSGEFKENIDAELIKKIVKMSIFDEISNANYILTEREFYSKLSTDKISQSNADSEVILQGIIDLLAVYDDHLLVLDYKTGKLSNEKLENYKYQLNIYSEIAEKMYKKPATKKVLCLIDENKIIEI